MTSLEKSKDPMSITQTTRDGLDPTAPGTDALNYVQQQNRLSEPSRWNSVPAQTREAAHHFQPLTQTGSARVCMSKALGAGLTGRKQPSAHTPGRGLSILPCAAGSAGAGLQRAVLQRRLRQFTRSCWAPSPAPSSSPWPHNLSGADTLSLQGLFIKPYFQKRVLAGMS